MAVRFLLLCIFLLPPLFQSQSIPCNGTLGAPIFLEDFGYSSQLSEIAGPLNPPANTSYTFKWSYPPNDGEYTITNYGTTDWGWITPYDHTQDPQGQYGNMMVVNASYTPGIFYSRQVDGLCSDQIYQFSAWIINLFNGDGIQPNITFLVEDIEGNLLGSVNTGEIPADEVEWNQYDFNFQIPNGITSVKILMRNNAPGGIGNDLAIDDIAFRTCNSSGSIQNSIPEMFTSGICPSEESILLTADFEVLYENPQYQWQLSTDAGANWQNISPILDSNTFSIDNISFLQNNDLIRVIVANVGNIESPNCRLVSDAEEIHIVNPTPPFIESPQYYCLNEEAEPLTAEGTQLQWYETEFSDTPLSMAPIPDTSQLGTNTYWVSQTIGSCESMKTQVSVEVLPIPALSGETFSICEGDSITLSIEPNDFQSYYWNVPTPIYNSDLTVHTPGVYEVIFENYSNCKNSAFFSVLEESSPVITDIEISLNSATIITQDNSTLSYSLDQINWQSHSNFTNLEIGFYDVYVRNEESLCVSNESFFIGNFPNVITPDGDGLNDAFQFNNNEDSTPCIIQIFDRFGKTIYQNTTSESVFWDGTYQGRTVPSDTYWYMLKCGEIIQHNGWIAVKNRP